MIVGYSDQTYLPTIVLLLIYTLFCIIPPGSDAHRRSGKHLTETVASYIFYGHRYHAPVRPAEDYLFIAGINIF